MVRPSWKGPTLSAAALLLLVGGGWIWLRDVSATTRPPAGTVLDCPGPHDPVISVNGGPNVATLSTGGISAQVGETYVNSQGLEVTDLTNVNILSQGQAEGIGDLTITNDPGRPAPPSSLTANQRGESFPATQVMQFHPVIILNGETFRTVDSAAPANVVNSDVPSIPPPPGTSYVLTNALTLWSDAGNTITVQPGKVFTTG